MAFVRFRSLAVPVILATLGMAAPALAQTPRTPPVFDELASPFTESEIGGLGCFVATVATGVGMTALMGGGSAVVAALGGVTTPRAVLEASAASAFVFSSACYVGQALAPVAMMGFYSVLDGLLAPRLPAHGGGSAASVSTDPQP